MFDKNKILDVLEYVLGVIALVGLFLFVHLNMSHELRDPDIWLHLESGEYIVQHRAIPKVDIFSSTMANKEWINHSWLVQVIFYLVFHFGGPDNLIFLSAIIVTLGFLILFLSVYKERNYLTLSIAILFLTIVASTLRFNIRPENFSVLFFSFYIYILTKWIHKKWIFLLPLIQLIWVNSHGFFILGPLMVGIFILAENLKRTNLLPWEWAKTDVLDSSSYKNLVCVFLLVCLSSFINPYGFKGAFYPLWVIASSIGGKSSIFYKHIQELLPTWRYYNVIFYYYGLIALSLVVFLLNFGRLNIALFLLWLIFLSISLRINRNIIFFNFFAFFTVTDGLIKLHNIKKNNFKHFFEKFKGLFVLLKFVMIIALIFVVIKKNYSILMSRYYIYEENRTKSSLLGITADRYPDKAADFILKNDLPGNIFNHFNHGSYLIYRFFPKKKVYIDGRTELYGDDFFKEDMKILSLDKDTINDVFNRYNINTVLLTERDCIFSDLPHFFFNSPDWALVYLDKNSLIFLKNAAENKTFINKLTVNLQDYKTPKADADIDKIGFKQVYPEPYIGRAWIFYYLGLDEHALNEAKEAIRIMPSCAEAYNIIGRVYIKRKLYDEAFEALRLARIYAPLDKETLISLGDYYTADGKFNDAVKVYKHLIKLNPHLAEAHFLLGRSYAQTNNTKLAIRSLRTALKLYPFDGRYYKELGELLYKNGDSKGAAEVYKNALSIGLEKTDFQKRLNAIYDKSKLK